MGGVCDNGRMEKLGPVIIVLTLLAAACTSDGNEPGFGCEPAPEDQRHSTSVFPLSVSENPVHPGASVNLNIGSTITQSIARSDDFYEFDKGGTGYGSTWQCWNGSEWVDTHLLIHNGETLAGEPGATTTVPAIELLIPESFSVVVPEVEPAWYRIAVDVVIFQPEGTPTQLVGHVAIEVVESP